MCFNIFPFVCFHTFTRKLTGIVAGGTATGAFPLRRLCRFYKEFNFMAEQLWKGRFSKAVDSRVNDFNSSIRFDQRMIAQDMRGSGVHATMLAKQGIISEKDCEDILNGLASIADDLASGKLEIDPNAEDVHTFVEPSCPATPTCSAPSPSPSAMR